MTKKLSHRPRPDNSNHILIYADQAKRPPRPQSDWLHPTTYMALDVIPDHRWTCLALDEIGSMKDDDIEVVEWYDTLITQSYDELSSYLKNEGFGFVEQPLR